MLREVLPNIAPQLIVVATLEAASAILLEAALSFLGLGVQPPLPSWGLMISEAKDYMFFSPWLIAIPGSALALLILAINLLGDGLRDVISPEAGADHDATRCSMSTASSVDIRDRSGVAARGSRHLPLASSAARRCAWSASPAAASP